MSVNRQTLFEEIWKEPMQTVARKYSVSGSYLTRVCERLKIPRPPTGHWSKVRVGKGVAAPELPALEPGDEFEWCEDSTPEEISRRVETRQAHDKSVAIAIKGRSTPHPLIAGARENFRNTYNPGNRGHLRPRKRLLLDLFVTSDFLEAALRTADRVIRGFEERSITVALARTSDRYERPTVDPSRSQPSSQESSNRWSPERITVAYVDGIAIGISLFEPTERVAVRLRNGKWVRATPQESSSARRTFDSRTSIDDLPIGRLCLRAYSPYPGTSWSKEWTEAESGGLVELVPQIVVDLANTAKLIPAMISEAKERWRIESEKWERQWREAEEHHRRARIKESRANSRAALLKIIDDWATSVRVSTFLNSIQEHAASLSDEEREKLMMRVRFAQELIGTTEHTIRFSNWKSPDELLKSNDGQ